MPLLIRTAVAADIPVIKEIEQRAASAGHWSQEQYQQVFGGLGSQGARPSSVLIIEAENKILGFLVARAVADEWEIENIVIDGPARQRGLGSRLLKEFLDQLRTMGATTVFLEVRESNRAARSLYERSGFVQGGHRKGYYRNPEEDAILYRLELLGLRPPPVIG